MRTKFYIRVFILTIILLSTCFILIGWLVFTIFEQCMINLDKSGYT